MSKLGDTPAIPQEVITDPLFAGRYAKGITVRQLACLMAMQGIVSNPDKVMVMDGEINQNLVNYSIMFADAVLNRELETRGK